MYRTLCILLAMYEAVATQMYVTWRGVEVMWEIFTLTDVINYFCCYWAKRIKYMIDEISRVLHVICNPLHYALKYDLERLVWLLLKLRFDPNRDVKGSHLHPYPLAWANYDNPRVIRMLLEAGANLEASTYQHHNPLLRAMLVRNFETMKLLLEYNVNVNYGLQTTDTALHKAIEIADVKLIQWLKDHGAEHTVTQDVTTYVAIEECQNTDLAYLIVIDETQTSRNTSPQFFR